MIFKNIAQRSEKHPLYHVWWDMRDRCNNQKHINYHRYGGRGITVCQEWNNFETFFAWAITKWKKGLQIDRRDNDGNYCPGNCRFVTASVNMQNTERAKEAKKRAVLIRTEYGEGATVNELTKKYNLRIDSIRSVLRNISSYDPNYIVPDCIKGRKNTMTLEKAGLLRYEYAEGVTIKQLSEKHNLTYGHILDILRNKSSIDPDYIIPDNISKQIGQEKVDTLRMEYKEGVSREKLMRKYNIGKDAMLNILRNETWIDLDYIVPKEIKKTKIRLTKETVAEIRKEFATGKVTQIALAKKYKIHETYVRELLYNQARFDPNYIVPDLLKILRSRKMTKQTVAEMRTAFSKGDTRKGLIEKYNISESAVSEILNNKSWYDPKYLQ